MSAPPNKRSSPSPPRARCFCGAPQAPELEYYCSIKCAREDALNALTLGAPHTSDQPLAPPLPTLPPDFFKPPIVGRGSHHSISSIGSDEGLPSHVDLGPFAPLHPRSKPYAIVPRADVSKQGHASCSSTRSSGSDKPRWKSHYRRLRERESLHSLPDAIQQAFQTASASATDDSFGSSSAVSSNKGKLTQKMVNDALRASFGQPAPTANDLDFFDSSALQNPRKLMPRQSIKSSTGVRPTSHPTSTRGASSTSSALCPTIPPGLDFATQSPASRRRALGSVFGRSESSLHVHLTVKETPAAQEPWDANPSLEPSTIEFDNTTPLERPLRLPPLAKQPSKGSATRLFLPLRQIGSQHSFCNQNPPQRLPFTTGSPRPAPTATQPSTRLGIVVRQSILSTKRRLPIGGGPTKPSADLKPGDSRADRVPLFLQHPMRETEVPKLPPSSGIEDEDEDASDANSERFSAHTRCCTMTPIFPTAPPSNTLSLCVRSIPSLPLETPEQTFTSGHDDGREMDDISSPCTSECPVTPADSAFTLGNSQLHPSAPEEWSRSKRSMEESNTAIFNFHRRFESAIDLGEVTPIGEKRFALASEPAFDRRENPTQMLDVMMGPIHN